MACEVAAARTSGSVPEILSVQFVSLGYSLQSMNLRPAGAVAVAITFTSICSNLRPGLYHQPKVRTIDYLSRIGPPAASDMCLTPAAQIGDDRHDEVGDK